MRPTLYALAGALAAVLVTTTSALAGSGVGGVFNLGQSNTVNATSVLSGSSVGPQLKVQNSISGNHGVLAQSAGGAGVALYGQHTSAAGIGPAVRGDSTSTAVGAFSIYGLLSSTAPGANSAALRGENKATNANGYGVWGSHAGAGKGVYGSAPTGTGVFGAHTSTSGTDAGVQGESASTAQSAVGVLGRVTAGTPGLNSAGVKGTASGQGVGVWGSNASGYGVVGTSSTSTGVLGTSTGGWGVAGYANGGFGVYGQSATGYGVYGNHAGSSGTSPGAFGVSNSTSANAVGVLGHLNAEEAGANAAGVKGTASAGIHGGNATPVYAVWGSMTGTGVGVYGSSTLGTGVYGTSDSRYSTNRGVVGVLENADCQGVFGTGGCALNNIGLFGKSTGSYGVYGRSESNNGVYGSSSSGDGVLGTGGTGPGVYGYSTNASGVVGESLYGHAGYFFGDVHVNATLSKAAGSFKIDHPLHPASQYLQHSFVESPDMMNVYNGNVVTDGKGFATVKLPNYFQALNKDFRYQLTIVGTRGWNARVVKEIAHNRFTIQTDQPGVKVSWQVTGIRQDRFANANRIRVVTPKTGEERSRYLHPQLYGQQRSKAIGAEFRRPPRQAVPPAR